MHVLSIQSEVVFGHVGNGAARFALQRLGHEVWAIPTVLYSNHAGYAHVTGEAVPAGQIRALAGGLEMNGWLPRCDAVLSGYLGAAEQAGAVADVVARIRRANPRAVYLLDPVFGDEAGAYGKPGVAEAMARSLLPLADIVSPNRFELAALSGVSVRDAGDAIAAARRLARPLVLATSIPEGDARLGTLAVSGGEAWFATAPVIADAPHGSGDLLAALFVAAHLEGLSPEKALARAMRAVVHVLMASAGHGELRLVAEQAALAAPPEAAGFDLRRVA